MVFLKLKDWLGYMLVFKRTSEISPNEFETLDPFQGYTEPALTCTHEGWIVSGQEIAFCWIPVLQLTMVVSSVAIFLLSTY
jgi:hypothetical protein